MYDVLQKMGCIETIEITQITDTDKIWFSAKLYHYKAGYPDRLELITVLPLKFDDLNEVRGFLKGFETILGFEFFITKIETHTFRLDSWMKVSREQIKVCFQNDHALTPPNLPCDIFLIETNLNFLKLDSES